jgi:hypothetical protein
MRSVNATAACVHCPLTLPHPQHPSLSLCVRLAIAPANLHTPGTTRRFCVALHTAGGGGVVHQAPRRRAARPLHDLPAPRVQHAPGHALAALTATHSHTLVYPSRARVTARASCGIARGACVAINEVPEVSAGGGALAANPRSVAIGRLQRSVFAAHTIVNTCTCFLPASVSCGNCCRGACCGGSRPSFRAPL